MEYSLEWYYNIMNQQHRINITRKLQKQFAPQLETSSVSNTVALAAATQAVTPEAEKPQKQFNLVEFAKKRAKAKAQADLQLCAGVDHFAPVGISQQQLQKQVQKQVQNPPKPPPNQNRNQNLSQKKQEK